LKGAPHPSIEFSLTLGRAGATIPVLMNIGRVFGSLVGVAALIVSAASGQQQAAAPSVPPALTFVPIRPIEPPARPLPRESESTNVTRFSFIAYGDTRSAGPMPGAETQAPGDGDVVHPIHSRIVDAMIARIRALANTPFPVRFVIHSGDAVLRGANAAQWNVSFTPIVDRLIRDGGVSYFFSVGNHDVTGMPAGDPSRMMGLHNALTALSRLIPPEGSPRRLSAYPTYSIGFGNTFLIAFDSNVASDHVQLAWVTDQLEHLDRNRYRHVVAFFHHPPFSSGPHGGRNLEPASAAIRSLYMPLFRKHHVRLIVAGHDHLYDHWVERYVDHGAAYRIDSIVTAGGGAPTYTYSGEPDLEEYLAAGAAAGVRVEHVAAPGPTQADNPHHFVVIQVDGDALSLEVVGLGEAPLTPYKDSARVSLGDQGS
jgi:Calcineurin-like phosphoesterase